MTFVVLTELALKIEVFSDVTPCILVEIYSNYWKKYFLHIRYRQLRTKLEKVTSFEIHRNGAERSEMQGSRSLQQIKHETEKL
jgi:hypothetical protein